MQTIDQASERPRRHYVPPALAPTSGETPFCLVCTGRDSRWLALAPDEELIVVLSVSGCSIRHLAGQAAWLDVHERNTARSSSHAHALGHRAMLGLPVNSTYLRPDPLGSEHIARMSQVHAGGGEYAVL